MKKTIIFIIIAICCNMAIAQSTSCSYKGHMHIDDRVANKRILNFSSPDPGHGVGKSKKDIINSLVSLNGSPATQDSYFSYNSSTFLSLLKDKIFTAGTGMRIYFGATCPVPDRNGQADSANKFVSGRINYIIPIFVATKETTDNDIDVEEGGFIMTENGQGYIHVSGNAVSAWKNNFVTTVLTALNDELGSENDHHQDTQADWYDNLELRDLVKYLENCVHPTPPKIELHFAAYEFSDKRILFVKHGISDENTSNVSNQFTLIFKVPGAHIIGAPFKNIMNKKKELLTKDVLKNKRLSDDNFDTGVPCPPDNSCLPGGGVPLRSKKK